MYACAHVQRSTTESSSVSILQSITFITMYASVVGCQTGIGRSTHATMSSLRLKNVRDYFLCSLDINEIIKSISKERNGE